MNDNKCCISNILEVICVLQNKSEKLDNIANTCDRPFLGISGTPNSFVFNTRPVTCYNCNNELITMPYTLTVGGTPTTGTSSVFRIEKVCGCCLTFRVLAPNPDTTSVLPYVATDSFFILNCDCVCALRCLNDTFIDCI